MSHFIYRLGDATAPEGAGPRIVAHIVNDQGAWGAGFVVALSRRWDEPEASYRAWAERDPFDAPPFRLSETQFVAVGDGITVANMCAQQGFPSRHRPCALDYYALRNCLRAVRRYALAVGASVHMPRIGCGIAGGEWSLVELIVRDILVESGVLVTVYDLDARAAA